MFNTLRKFTVIICTIALSLSMWIFSVAAAANATISFSNSKPAVGQSVTVTVTVKGGEAIYDVTFELKYNPDVLKYESASTAVNAGGAGLVKANAAPGGKTKDTYTFTFSSIASGTSNISVSGTASGVENDLNYGASATLTVGDAAKSDNAGLKSLSLSAGTLSPKFSTNKTTYTASVADNVTECKIFATAVESGANVEVSGDAALKVGKNVRTVTVTAPSGKQKTYKITITRGEEGTEGETVSEPDNESNETVIDGVSYTVATDISGLALPNGFTAETAEYNGTQVAVAKDKGGIYTLYYLKNAESENYVPYMLSKSGDTFERLKYATFGSNTYIFADLPDGYTVPDGYYETDVKIGDFDVIAYAKNGSEDADFYYLYCFFEEGFNTYRYDSVEKVLQRCPEFKLVKADEQPQKNGFAARFAKLSSNAKTVVIGMVIALVAAIALIVMLAVKLIGGKDNNEIDKDSEMFSDEFDNVTVSNAENRDTQKEDGEEQDKPEEVADETK